MNKLTVIIIEDEKPAARLLTSMLGRLRPEWDIRSLPGSVASSVKWFESNPEPALVFLDIQLSDGNSFLFLEQTKPQCPIIFTTAYDEYAIRAFSVNSIDYLLKPFDETRLEEAVVKFESLSAIQLPHENIIDALKAIVLKEKKYRTRFLIKGIDKFETLQVEEIAYVHSVVRITFAVLKSGNERIVDVPLDKLAEQLDPDRFFRVNRQFIVNIDAIKKIEPYFGGKVLLSVVPTSKEAITVSKEKLSLFKQWVNY